MASTNLEVRICLRHKPDGRVMVSFWDPIGRKEIKVRQVVGPDLDEIDRFVRARKHEMEAQGHWVSFADLHDKE